MIHIVEYAPYLSHDGAVQRQQMEKAVSDQMNAMHSLSLEQLQTAHIKMWTNVRKPYYLINIFCYGSALYFYGRGQHIQGF